MARDQRTGPVLFALLALACQVAWTAASPATASWTTSACEAVPEPGCPATGSVDLPLPCSGNCRSYASCKDGAWEKKTCFWPWTRFSPQKRTCVLMNEVDCDWWVTEYAGGDDGGDDGAHDGGAGQCGSPSCPKSGSALLPNPCPGACQDYYNCTDGQAIAQKCYPWENFDPVSLECVIWDLVDCTWANPTTLPPPTTEAPTEPPTTDPTPAPPCEFTPTCPGQGEAIIADPCRCQAYFACADGNAEEELCLPWENFDPNLDKCVWWSDVDCSWPDHLSTTPIGPTVTTEPTTPETEPTSPQTVPTTPSTPQTEPTSPQTVPTTPSTPQTEPTSPQTVPTTPSTPQTEPTSPQTVPTSPTTPETEPTSPETEATSPTTPETEPTSPETEATSPTTPETEPTSPETEPPTTPTTPEPRPTIIPNCDFVPDCPAQGEEKLPIPCDGISKRDYVQCTDGVAKLTKCRWNYCFNKTERKCKFTLFQCMDF